MAVLGGVRMSATKRGVKRFTPRWPRPVYPLSVSGRWIVQGDGSRFDINGEAGWSLGVNCTQADATRYLRDRAAKGVNLVMVNLIEHAFTDNSPVSRNANGDLPFTGTTGGEEDFTTPNEAYWAHWDWLFAEGFKYGITFLPAPAYPGFQHGSEGWAAEIAINGDARMTTYGDFLGNRYKNTPNLIWMMGGDAAPVFGGSDLTSEINALANAIKAADSNHLMTAHSAPGRSAFDDYNQSWLDINTAYALDNTKPHVATRTARQQSTKPCFLVESYYRNEHGITDLDSRTTMWQAVLGGGCGHIHGEAPTWYFGQSASSPANGFADIGGQNWKNVQNSYMADVLPIVRAFTEVRDLSALTPDYSHTRITAGYDSGGVEGVTYAPSTGNADVLCAYTRGAALTVDRSQFTAATFNLNWYNPRTGVVSNGGTVSMGSGSQVFTPLDSNDWVLMLDKQSLGLPVPKVA